MPEPFTYPFGEHLEHISEEQGMALLALSHTPLEHRLYQAMRVATAAVGTRLGAFSPGSLRALTGIKGYATIRRALQGLLDKLSVESQKVAGDSQPQGIGSVYLVFSPQEIFARRRMMGLAPYPQEIHAHKRKGFGLAIERVAGLNNLSRREAQVALCCVEGLTNAQIGLKLKVSEQTVKFHLRHIFVKFGVRRRTELVSRLLTREGEQSNGHG
ncbi:MAG TPA: helix-turn-helix transcriptional regulator [Pyrinomonadaceae bacterium]